MPRRPARRLDHGRSHGIDADDQCRRIGGRLGQHGPSVTGPKVDHDPGVILSCLEQLADVDLRESPSGQHVHLAQYAKPRSS